MNILEINEILKLVEKLEQHEFGSLKKPLKQHTHTSLFIQNLRKFPSSGTDEEMAMSVFGDPMLTSHYFFLKSRTTSLLLDALLERSVRKNIDSKLTQGIVEAARQYTIITVIERSGRRTIAKKLARKTVLLCKKYQITPLAIELLELLRHYSVLDGDKKAYASYSKELQTQIHILHDTTKIQAIDHEIRIALSKHLISELPIRWKLIETLTEIHHISARHRDNFTIRTTAYRLQYMCSQLKGDSQKSLRACKQAR